MSEDEKKKSMQIMRFMSSIDSTALQSWNFDVTHYSFDVQSPACTHPDCGMQELIGALCLMFKDLGLAVFMEDFDTSEALVPIECLWEFIHHVQTWTFE